MNDLAQLHEDFKLHIHSDTANFADIKKDIKEVKDMLVANTEALKPLTEAYNGVEFSRKFLMGLAGMVLAIGAVGAGIIWLINSVVHK